MSDSSRISYNTLTYSTPLQLTSLGYFSSDQFFFEIVQNSFFPLFTELSRFCHLPHFIDGIQLLLMIIQEIGVTNWCGSLNIDRERNSCFDIIFWFTDWGIVRTSKIDDCIIQYLIGFGIFLLTNFFLLFIILYYQQTHNFVKAHLYILRFLFFPLLSYLIPIYGCFIGRSFTELMTKKPNSISIIFFIFSIPIYIISIYELYFANKFTTNTPVIDQSLIGTWDDQLIFLTLLSISLGSILQIILDVFPKWIHISALIGYIFILLYRIYFLYFAPMLRYWMNTLFLSVCLMSITNCIFSIVHLFVSKIPSWIYISVSFFFLFVFFIFSFFWYRSKKQKYLKKLTFSRENENENENENEIPNELDKRRFFDQIIFSSARDAISFMHIGVMFQSESIIDFSFLRYLIENYAEPEIIIAVSKVASFFPSETRFLNCCLTEVTKICKKHITDDFLIYQMRLILVIRQSSVSVEASTQLGVLQKMSRDTISQVRGFWAEILNAKTDISFSSLQYLRKLTMKTDSAFLDACDCFPNNVSIMNEYCRFQIEGMGNFMGAISSSKKMFLLDQGKNLTIDHVFKALVNVYPDYLLKNIFTIHGNLIGNGFPRDSSSFSISSTISNQEDFEEKYDEIISQLYLHGKLRIALQLRMKSTKLWPFQFAFNLSSVQLLFSVIVFLLIIFTFPISSYNALNVIECCNEFSKVSLHLQYISCIVGIRAAIKKRAFSGVNMLRSQLGISSSDLKNDPSFFHNPEKAIFNSTRKLREQLDVSTRALLSSMPNVVDNLATFSMENTKYVREKNLTQNLTIQSSIAQYCYTAEVLSTIISTSSNDIDRLSEELLINTNTITASLEILQISLNDQGIKIIQNMNNFIKYTSIIVVFVGCFLFLCFRIYNFIVIFDQIKQLSNLLRKIDPDLINESFSPIALKEQSENIRGTNPHSAHEYNILLVLHPILIAISFIAIITLSIVSINYYFDSLNIIDSVFQWFIYGNVRFSSILGSLVILCAGSTNAIDHETEYSILTSKMNYLFITQKYIDLTLMRIDPQINRLFFSKLCRNMSSTTSYKEYARCLSLSSKIYVATSAIQNLVEDNAPINLNNQDFATLIYLVDTFLFEELERFQELIVQYSFNHFDSSSSKTLAMCVSGLVASIIIYLVEQAIFVKYQQSVDAIKQLISMLPPVAVATSTALMKFINNGIENEDGEVNLTASESILAMTSTPALMLNKGKTIQAVNKAVNNVTGFLPDQILGQNVKWLIPLEADYGQKVNDINKRFYAALEALSGEKVVQPNTVSNSNGTINDMDSMLTQNESANDDEADLIFSSTMAVTTAPTVAASINSERSNIHKETETDSNMVNTTTFSIRKNGYSKIPENDDNAIVLTAMCLTESGTIIPAQATILHIKDRLTANDQFVILLRDISREVEMQKAAQETRMKTNKLLTSLIPSSLVSSIISSAQANLSAKSQSDNDSLKESSQIDSKSSIGSKENELRDSNNYHLKKSDKQSSSIEDVKVLNDVDLSQNKNKESDVKAPNDVDLSQNKNKESDVKAPNDVDLSQNNNKESDVKAPNDTELSQNKNKESDLKALNDVDLSSNKNKESDVKASNDVDLSQNKNKESDAKARNDNESASSLIYDKQNAESDSEEYKSIKIENDDDSENNEKLPSHANNENEQTDSEITEEEEETSTQSNVSKEEEKMQNKKDSDESKTHEKVSNPTNYSLNSSESKANNSITNEIGKNNVFLADYVTVILIKIISLNDYVHILQPSQLMKNLKVIYDEFEKVSKEYPAVSILKMNNEEFMACCGLFPFIGDKKEQTKQAVSYSLKIMKNIELINEELDIDLHLRIGINSGGPVIGGMLSPLVPSFEIFGEFISSTKKIQREGEVGFLNVSEKVASQLDSSIFKVEKGISSHGNPDDEIPFYIVSLND